MNSIVEKLYNAGEPYAAALLEYSDRDIFLRVAHAHSVFLKTVAVPQYDGKDFYPCGLSSGESYAVMPQCSFTFSINKKLLNEKDESFFSYLKDDFTKSQYDVWRNDYYVPEKAEVGEYGEAKISVAPHTVAGFCYSHSLPHYGRILKEGLSNYRERINTKNGKLKEGLTELLDGIYVYRTHCIEYLESHNGKPELIAALRKVPFAPAENIYEALVGWNFLYFMDCCDNVGRLDEDLLPFWKGEDFTPLLREFFEIVDRTNGYSSSIGPDYNGITLMCLKAIHGLRRPEIELRITQNMPDEVWNAAIEALIAGGTNPSLYNEAGYKASFHDFFPDMPPEDFKRFCGVGCTESSLAGISNAGSLDAGIHLPYIFSKCMRESLSTCKTFEEFYAKFMTLYKSELKRTLDGLYVSHKIRARCRPVPMRSLFIDDCIDKDADFNNGGARYSWSVINFAGIVNLIEDMIAVKQLVFNEKLYTAEDFVKKLDENDPIIYARCKKCPHYGVDNNEVDSFAGKLLTEIFDELEKYKTFMGGKHLAASIQFMCCVSSGKIIPATPDGRHDGDPLADSISAINGNDINGVTAMLNSVTKLPLAKMLGTPVLNLKLEKSFLRDNLKSVITGYFAGGGLQVQLNCLSKEDMLDAMEHPEKHGNLVVRVSGYSEYFVRLPEEIQRQIISRTEFA